MELVVDPLAVVSYFARGVVEATFPFHVIEAPLSLVKPSSLVLEHSETMPHVLPLFPSVLAAQPVLFTDIVKPLWFVEMSPAVWRSCPSEMRRFGLRRGQQGRPDGRSGGVSGDGLNIFVNLSLGGVLGQREYIAERPRRVDLTWPDPVHDRLVNVGVNSRG